MPAAPHVAGIDGPGGSGSIDIFLLNTYLSVMDIPLPNRLAALALALADAQDRAMQSVAGLGRSAVATLVTLGPYPGSTIGSIAAIAGVTHSVAVRLVDQLVAAGLVERRAGHDRRAVALALTPAGDALRRRLLAAREEAVTAALDAIPPARRTALAEAVDALLTALTPDRRRADHLCRFCDEDACGDDCPVEERARALEGDAP